MRRAGIYVASALISALIPFLLLPILARALGPEGYGLVGAFTGLVTVACVLVGLSTHGVLTTVYFRVDKVGFDRYIAACLLVAVVTGPTLWLIAVGVGPWLRDHTGIPPAWYWALVGASIGQFLLSVALAVCQIRGQAIRFAALQISNVSLNLLLTVGLVIGLAWNWEGRALAQCLATLAVGLAGLVLINRGLPPLKTNRETMKTTLSFGASLVPHALATTVTATADRLILLAIVGAGAAGHYFAAFQIAGVVWLTSSAINQAMAPWLFRSLAAEQGGSRIVVVTYAVALGLVGQGALIAMLAEPLVRIFGGAEFLTAVPIVRILTIAMTIRGIYFLFTNYLYYAHKTFRLSAATVCVTLCQIPITIGLTQVYGIYGAAWAAVLINAVYVSAIWALAARAVPLPWFSFWRSA